MNDNWTLADMVDDERDDPDQFEDWDDDGEDWMWSDTIARMDHILRQHCHTGYQPPS